MKKAAPASAGRDKAEGARSSSGSDSRETELKEAGSSSSSSFSDEPQGFTLASEVYSVTLLFYFPRFLFIFFFLKENWRFLWLQSIQRKTCFLSPPAEA